MNEPVEQTDPLVSRVGRTIDAHRLIAPRSRVLVGVSGGADSVALLSVLLALSREPARDYHLTVAHLDHALRDAAAGDAAWVGELARAWSLPYVTRRFDVGRWAQRRRQGLEEAGRAARLAFFRHQASLADAHCIAVGHHADDNVETVLYRIVRGTHVRGLAGMAPSRRLEGERTLVRPLLECTRRDIEAYCRRTDLAWRTDETNVETVFARNFIRHDLLPLLREKLNPQADAALLRLAGAARDAAELIDEQADKALHVATREYRADRLALDAAALCAYPPVVRAAAIRRALERLGAPLRQVGADRMAELTDALDGAGGGVDLPGGFQVRRQAVLLVIQRCPQIPTGQDPWDGPVALAVPGRTALPDGREILCAVRPYDADAFAEHCRLHPPGVELLDAEAAGPVLHAGPRVDGERFDPLGLGGRQTVGDFLTNLKIPPPQRRRAVCVRDETGIVYLAPLRLADRVKVTRATRRILEIRITE